MSQNVAAGPYTNKSLKKCDNTIVIYILFRLQHMLCDIKSVVFYTIKGPHGIGPNAFSFHTCRVYSNGSGQLTKPKQTIELCKHRAQVPLILAECNEIIYSEPLVSSM